MQEQEINLVTVANDLLAKGLLKELGGVAALAQYTLYCESSLYAQSYADVIREKSKRRRSGVMLLPFCMTCVPSTSSVAAAAGPRQQIINVQMESQATPHKVGSAVAWAIKTAGD